MLFFATFRNLAAYLQLCLDRGNHTLELNTLHLGPG